jgi:hypothetical protein
MIMKGIMMMIIVNGMWWFGRGIGCSGTNNQSKVCWWSTRGECVFMLRASEWERHLIEMEDIEMMERGGHENDEVFIIEECMEKDLYVFMLWISEWEQHLIEMEDIERRERSGKESNEEQDGSITVSLRKRYIKEENYLY